MTPILRSTLLVTFLLVLFEFHAILSHAQTADEHVKQDLLKLEQALITGVRAHDTTALKDIVANEYQLVFSKLEPVRREQWLQKCLLWSFDSATINRVSLTNWEQIAVFRSLQNFYDLVIGGNPSIAKTEAWVTDLWIKRDNRWQLVTRVSERLPQK